MPSLSLGLRRGTPSGETSPAAAGPEKRHHEEHLAGKAHGSQKYSLAGPVFFRAWHGLAHAKLKYPSVLQVEFADTLQKVFN